MKSTTKANISTIIGSIVISATFIVYILATMGAKRAAIDWLSLFFILFSEALFFGGITFLSNSKAYKDKAFIKSGIETILFIYWIIATLYSLLFSKYYSDNIAGFIAVHITIFAVAAIISILLAANYKTVYENNKQIIDAEAFIREYQDSARLLSVNAKYSKYQDDLNKLYENLRYGDKTIVVDEDWDIRGKLSLLSEKLVSYSEGDDQLIYSLINDIQQVIKQRDLTIRKLKRGGV